MGHGAERWLGAYKSFTGVADAVLERWHGGDGETPPKPRSLAAKLSDLARGKTTWWERRPQARAALAEVLGEEEADLFGAATRSRDVRLLPFPDFPQLRPFDPARETPCDIATWERQERPGGDDDRRSPFRWFRPSDERGWEGNAVVEVPPGAGRRFLVHWYRHRPEVRVYQVDRLEQAVGAFEGRGPTVLSVEEPTGLEDVAALRRIGRRQEHNLLVVTPFAIAWPDSHGWLPSFARDTLPDERLATLGLSWNWERYRWRPAKDWRPRFLEWCADRVEGNGLFDPDALARWLAEVDASEQVFRTPGDLLPVCALAHEVGERRLPRRLEGDFADRWVAARSDPQSRAPLDEWLRVQGRQAVDALSVGAFRDLSIGWSAGATAEEWAALLPQDTAPNAATSGELEGALRAVVAGKTRQGREAAAAALRDVVSQAGPAAAVGFLRRAGLLRPTGPGRFALYPRWLNRLRLRGWLRERFVAASPAEWGRLSLSPDRRDILDEELRSLSDDDFLRLVDRVCGQRSLAGLGNIAAVESLFAAAARRFETGWRPPLERVARLQDLQFAAVIRRYSDAPPAPLTRPGLGEAGDAGLAWLGDCWTWATFMNAAEQAGGRPTAKRVEEPWLFPDVRVLAETPPPPWIAKLCPGPQPQRSGDSEEWPSDGFLRVARRALALTSTGVAVGAPKDWPDVLLPAAIVAAAGSGQRAGEALADRLLQRRWVQREIAAAADTLPPAGKTALAGTVWSAMLRAGRRDAFGLLTSPAIDPLAAFAVQYLDDSGLLHDLEAADPSVVAARTSWLPVPLRRRLAHWIADSRPDLAPTFLAYTDTFEPEDAAAVLELARRVPAAAFRAHAVLWALAGDAALAEAVDALRQGDAAAAWPWFRTAPESALDELLDVLEEQTDRPPPDWRRHWLLTRLPGAGSRADRIFRLLAPAATT